MMGQFVGRETIYRSLFGSIIEIYKDSGIAGFFSGILPRLLFEVACLVLSSSTVYILNKYFIKDKMARQYNTSITQVSFDFDNMHIFYNRSFILVRICKYPLSTSSCLFLYDCIGFKVSTQYGNLIINYVIEYFI